MDTIISPRRRELLGALGAAALLAGCGEPGLSGAPRRAPLAFRGESMGTTWTAKLAGELPPALAERARHEVTLALGRVVALMSTFDPESELSRFNRHEAGTPFAVSPETLAVFALAREVSEATGGAFDATVAPAVDAWGFGPANAPAVPPRQALDALAGRIDWRAIAIDARAGTLAKSREGIRADLSGIAKGFAVDQAARALERLGIGDYMVEAGGEVRARGRNAEGRPWRIGIERPDAVPPRAELVVGLADLAMATSGDYRTYFEAGGRRYSHEIDPATREPAAGPLASVTVVDADCGRADALATALFVLGMERGHALAERRGLAACFIAREPAGGYRVRDTSAFAALGPQRARG